ncbi:MAG: TIGR03032 family protein [Cytophagaceae bacterium]|jgi:uncharacterized protein (TIGR03032 family)|nr:TIGR03032 family protein [Cytophagaceae bacterium]
MNFSGNKTLPPFTMVNSAQVPELFMKLNCTLVISTYQAGKVILISAQDHQKLTMLPRTFNKAMGVAIEGNKMAIACKDEVVKLVDSPELAIHYPNQPGKYKNLYTPRATYYTGTVDLHDLHFGTEGLWGVNTSFSCLCLINDDYSFIPKWKPNFINELISEDRCHLNGLAMLNGKPKYVTALGTGNKFQSWREDITNGGVLIDIETNEMILKNLSMPHSPRMHNGELYLLQSASGEIIKFNPETKTIKVIKKFEAFVRGMAIHGDYMFVGVSKPRANSSTFAKLPFASNPLNAGIIVLHLPTKSIAGEMVFQTSVDEIYDVQIIPNSNSVGILNTLNEVHRYSLSIPGATFWAKISEQK